MDGSAAENPAFWGFNFTNSSLTDLSGLIQLNHGTADTIVPVAYSDMLNQQIQAVNGNVEYFSYLGDDHNISRNLGTALAWFRHGTNVL